MRSATRVDGPGRHPSISDGNQEYDLRVRLPYNTISLMPDESRQPAAVFRLITNRYLTTDVSDAGAVRRSGGNLPGKIRPASCAWGDITTSDLRSWGTVYDEGPRLAWRSELRRRPLQASMTGGQIGNHSGDQSGDHCWLSCLSIFLVFLWCFACRRGRR